MVYYFLSNTICRESIGIIKTFDDEFVKELILVGFFGIQDIARAVWLIVFNFSANVYFPFQPDFCMSKCTNVYKDEPRFSL